MIRLIGLVVSIGLADALNPTTIAPALLLAAGEHPRRNVAYFTLAVFCVFFLGGAAVALGPGELILDFVPHPHHTARHIVEIVAGVMMLIVAGYVWRNRIRLANRQAEKPLIARRRSGILLGITISVVEFPTALPYFAAITAIIGAGTRPPGVIVLLLLFNFCFILPLLMILAVLWLAHDRATEILGRWRARLQRNWPVLLSSAALLAGTISILIGVSGLLLAGHGPIANVVRRIRHILHLPTKP
ncbi:MAG: GAP family protein [Solirubrobacteraceae bacterium]